MNLAPVPANADHTKSQLQRRAWNQFPDVVIHAEESFVKKHRSYNAAKGGDAGAAAVLVLESISLHSFASLDAMINSEAPRLLPVHAAEVEGVNVIPRLLAQTLGRLSGLPVELGIVQTNRVRHTGAGGYQRLAAPAFFDGIVKPEKYLLVDDFIGQGGTLANLKGFLESRGAQVIGATTLTGKGYSAKLRLGARNIARPTEQTWNRTRTMVDCYLRLWL